MKFYISKTTGEIVTKLTDKEALLSSNGEEMVELTANSTEAATEKHKPIIVEEDGQKYAIVGSVVHPMTPAHYIEWMVVDYGTHQVVKHFEPTDEPKFKICNSAEIKDIYAYCNLHGLWKLDK